MNIYTAWHQAPLTANEPYCDLRLLVHCWESQRRCPVVFKFELHVAHRVWLYIAHCIVNEYKDVIIMN